MQRDAKSKMSEVSQRYGMERREVDDKNRVDISGVEKGRILLTAVVTETERAFEPRSSGQHQACHVVYFQPQGVGMRLREGRCSPSMSP